MKITVTRFDPSQDASPYEQSFDALRCGKFRFYPFGIHYYAHLF